MIRTAALVVALLVVHACGEELELDAPADLPDRVVLRTETESFNRDWSVAVREGRIWIRANQDTGEREGDWELLGKTGLPEGGGLVRFDPPEEIVAVSVDGCHVQALSSDGVWYRGTDMRKDVRDHLTWTDRWGWLAGNGPGLTAEVEDLGWDVSDSHPFDVHHYEDILGTEHSVGMGVAHLYRLDADRRTILFNDWWLPADWSRTVCGPERGTLPLVDLSASGSTVFVVAADGSLHTRLYDFDTAGENDLYTYSFILDGPSGTTRALPAEPWRRQPAPDGVITDAVTIFQDGQGNAARVLRVAGSQSEQSGYFEKRIFEEDWRFVTTGEPAVGAALPTTMAPIDPEDQPLLGRLTREGSAASLELELEDFNLLCSPAQVRILVDGEPVAATLHHVQVMVEEIRPYRYWEKDIVAEVRAALVLPESGLPELFDGRRVINFIGEATPDSLTLEEIPRSMPFRVPNEEKGKKGELFGLVAALPQR
jgi:hypothetical protein